MAVIRSASEVLPTRSSTESLPSLTCPDVPPNASTSDAAYSPLGQLRPRHPGASSNYDVVHPRCTQSPDSRVMVHCLTGISQSATVVCAYLIATARVTPHEALMAVKGKRGIVSPKIWFLPQLDRYADQLLGGQGRPHRAMMGKNVAETMPMLREAQRGPNPGSSSSTSTSTTSDVTSAPSG